MLVPAYQDLGVTCFLQISLKRKAADLTESVEMFTNLHGLTYQKTDTFTFILNT